MKMLQTKEKQIRKIQKREREKESKLCMAPFVSGFCKFGKKSRRVVIERRAINAYEQLFSSDKIPTAADNWRGSSSQFAANFFMHTPHTHTHTNTHNYRDLHTHKHTKDRHYRHKLVFRLVVQNAKCTYASLSLAKSANINFAQENSNENFKNAFYFVSKTQYFIALQKMEFWEMFLSMSTSANPFQFYCFT